MFKVYKEGIEREIKELDWSEYQKKGYVKVEKQPIQSEEPAEVEEPKPKAKKKG